MTSQKQAVAPARTDEATPSTAGPRWPALASAVLLVIGVIALLTGPRAAVDGFGLITALPWLYVATTVLMVALIAVNIVRWRNAPWLLYAQIVFLTVALALAPVLLEPDARFATAYTHAGFVDYIDRTGAVLGNYDARFSWPGFFAAAAMFVRATGLTPDDLLRWTPLLLDLAYLGAFFALVARFTTSPRRRALAMLMFVLFNWVGQDYFAPQGFAFLLYLVFAASAAALFIGGTRENRLFGWIARITRRQPAPVGAEVRPVAMQLGLLATMLITFSAIVVSHQITPVFAIITVLVLTVLGFNRSWALPVLLLVLFLGYVVWGATNFWQGHLGDIFGGLGRLGAIQQNLTAIGSRLPGDTTYTAARGVVVDVRIAMAVALAAIAVIAFIRSRDRVLALAAVLALAPLLVLAVQSYGGEAILRIQLFTLPFTAIVAGHLLRERTEHTPPALGRRHVGRAVIAAGASCVVLIGFFVARYGNESFEEMRPSDVSTAQALYRLAPKGSSLVSINDSMPWKNVKIGDYEYVPLDGSEFDSGDANTVLGRLRAADRPVYLVVTESAWNEALQLEGVSSARVDRFKQLLTTTSWIRPVYGDAESGVFEIERNTP